jgi:hypothetical protein
MKMHASTTVTYVPIDMMRHATRMAQVMLVVVVANATNGWAAEAAGMIKTLKGTAHIERNGKQLPVAVGTEVLPKDRIVTGPNSSLGITLKDNTQLSTGANGQLEINKFSFNKTSHAGELDTTVKRGALSVISGKVAKANPDAVRFNSGTVTLGVRGTEFIIEAGDDE